MTDITPLNEKIERVMEKINDEKRRVAWRP